MTRHAWPKICFSCLKFPNDYCSFNKDGVNFTDWCVCYDVLSKRLNLEEGKKEALLRLSMTHPLYVFAGHLSQRSVPRV